MSRRAYARHRKAEGLTGGTEGAVRQAIAAGRLTAKSVTKAGKIRSAKAADAEWAATTKADYVPLTGPSASAVPTPSAPPSKTAAAVPPPDLATARARREATNAELAAMDLAERRGELVDASAVEARLTTLFTGCRNKIMGVPARLAQRDPTLTRAQIALVELELRSALEDLSTKGP